MPCSIRTRSRPSRTPDPAGRAGRFRPPPPGPSGRAGGFGGTPASEQASPRTRWRGGSPRICAGSRCPRSSRATSAPAASSDTAVHGPRNQAPDPGRPHAKPDADRMRSTDPSAARSRIRALRSYPWALWSRAASASEKAAGCSSRRYSAACAATRGRSHRSTNASSRKPSST